MALYRSLFTHTALDALVPYPSISMVNLPEEPTTYTSKLPGIGEGGWPGTVEPADVQ
jgi:hypothetical protein